MYNKYFVIFPFLGTTHTLGEAARCHGANDNSAGAAVRVHDPGCIGRVVGVAALQVGSAGVLLGAHSVLASVRLAAVVDCAARLDAVRQVRVCHRLAVPGADRAVSLSARPVESGHTLADAHL